MLCLSRLITASSPVLLLWTDVCSQKDSGGCCTIDLGDWCTWCETKGIILFLQDEDALLSSYAIDKTVEGGIKDVIKMSFIKIER